MESKTFDNLDDAREFAQGTGLPIKIWSDFSLGFSKTAGNMNEFEEFALEGFSLSPIGKITLTPMSELT